MAQVKKSVSDLASQICGQINSVFASEAAAAAVDVMVAEIERASAGGGRIFVYGVGREGLMLKGLCMRLFHLGLNAHCVFDMTTPPISATDLLIASAGPGSFSTVEAICGVSRSKGARVLLLTARPEAVVGSSKVSVVAEIPARSMADEEADGTLLPMGSLYEGALFVVFEIVVFRLVDVLGKTSASLRSRHTNLE